MAEIFFPPTTKQMRIDTKYNIQYSLTAVKSFVYIEHPLYNTATYITPHFEMS